MIDNYVYKFLSSKMFSGFCYVRFFTYLSVAEPKTMGNITDVTKIAIKIEKPTPFRGTFSIMENFPPFLHSFLYISLTKSSASASVSSLPTSISRRLSFTQPRITTLSHTLR